MSDSIVDDSELLSIALSLGPDSQSAVESIYCRYIPVIRGLAKRLSWDKDSFDELLQEGSLALVEALPLFDPSRGTRLSTFIHQRVQSRMRHWCRDQRLTLSLLTPNDGHRLVSLDEEIEGCDDGTMSLHDTVAADQDSPAHTAHVKIVAGFVRKSLAKLAARQAQVLRLRFMDDLPPSEIAERLGISRPRVTVLVQTGMEHLRSELAFLM